MAAGAAAAAAAIIQAIKASGVLVSLDPDQFRKLLSRTPEPLVIVCEDGFFSKNFKYLTTYKGLAFFTKSKTSIELPADAEVIAAGRIWIPG